MPINLSTLTNLTNPIQLCKAWVNFNGTGTIGQPQTIRSSYNVSSVTKNGTGDYTVNFQTAMADANYSVIHGGSFSAATMGRTIATQTGSSIQIGVRNSNTGLVGDDSAVHVAIFGN
jgi:hypothetical protein